MNDEKLEAKVAKYEGEKVTADAASGNMVFKSILEEGVFRFDCSETDRGVAFPSLSFVDSKLREKEIAFHKTPVYIPTYESLHGQQTVTIEVCSGAMPFCVISFSLKHTHRSSLSMILVYLDLASYRILFVWNRRSWWAA